MSDQINHPLIGATVHVKACGAKEAFTGVVETAWLYKPPKESGVTYFHVRDNADGTLWHREIRDLLSTPAGEEMAA
jgi:hypothetical protein